MSSLLFITRCQSRLKCFIKNLVGQDGMAKKHTACFITRIAIQGTKNGFWIVIIFILEMYLLKILVIINLNIENQSIGNTALRRNHDNLMSMLSYCENIVDCRRVLLLKHFGEQYNREKCLENEATTCDNCACKVCTLKQIKMWTSCKCLRFSFAC